MAGCYVVVISFQCVSGLEEWRREEALPLLPTGMCVYLACACTRSACSKPMNSRCHPRRVSNAPPFLPPFSRSLLARCFQLDCRTALPPPLSHQRTCLCQHAAGSHFPGDASTAAGSGWPQGNQFMLQTVSRALMWSRCPVPTQARQKYLTSCAD